MKAGLGIDANATASIDAQGAAFLGYKKDFPIASEIFDPFAIGPLVFVPAIDITAHVEGGASSRFHVSDSVTLDIGAEASYSTKNGGTLVPPHASLDAPAPTVDVTLGAHAKVSVGPELSLKLFDILGPTAGFSAYAELDADATQNPCFHAHVGVDGHVGADIGIELPVLGNVELANWDNSFPIVDKDVATGNCTLPPAGSKLPPGSGPDDATLLNPTFTPWAKTWIGDPFLYPYSTPDGLAFGGLSQTIDGRYIVTGSEWSAAVKMDETGKVLWANEYVASEDLSAAWEINSQTIQPGIVTPASDGTLLATAEPYTLVSLDQTGKSLWAQRYPVGSSTKYRRFVSVVSDGTSGFFAIGTLGSSEDDIQGVSPPCRRDRDCPLRRPMGRHQRGDIAHLDPPVEWRRARRWLLRCDWFSR